MKCITERLRPPVLFFPFALILLSACSSGGGNSSTPPLAESLRETLDNYLAEHQEREDPGISVVILKNGQQVYQASRGTADTHTGLPIRADTGFRLASITKTFTSLAVMQLLEERLLSLEDKLLDYIPELSMEYRDVTIHHLLTHQSGIPDYINDNNNPAVWDDVTTPQFIEDNSRFNELEFAPGTSAQYSNSGYVMLAVIVERLTGMRFPDYLEAYIFSPLGMSNSYVVSEFHQVGEYGEDTALNFATTTDVLNFNSLIYGSSGLVSTTEDMALFTHAWLNHELISPETTGLMIQSHAYIPDIGDYGYGWVTDRGLHSYQDGDHWHSGGYDGYQTLLYVSQDSALEIVALTNGGATTRDLLETVVSLTQRFYGQ